MFSSPTRNTICRSLFLAFAVAGCVSASAQTETVLYSFGGGNDGTSPSALVEDAAGNLYGTTYKGGKYNYGTVFELSPTSNGWQKSILHIFTGGRDGATPYSGVIIGPDGNLYGTAGWGGDTTLCGGGGCGVVFELYRTANGGWAEKVLNEFSGGVDGEWPQGLAFDPSGNLYGFAGEGGTQQTCDQLFGCGTVFRLTPQSSSAWQFQVIHIFTGGEDGGAPAIGQKPVIDAAGNVYGSAEFGGNGKLCTTWFSGVAGCGVLFRLSPTPGGGWIETQLYRFFGGTDGAMPAGLLLGPSGNALVWTDGGGSQAGDCRENDGCGVIDELTPTASGPWNEETLHTFSFNDGNSPTSLSFDASGNLYGVTEGWGNTVCNCGSIFEMSPASGGWTFTTLYQFAGGTDGSFPKALLIDSAGHFYGSTSQGGPANSGTIFQFAP